jgi:hypothetical protein
LWNPNAGHRIRFSLQLFQTNTHFSVLAYLYQVSPTCFGIRHTIFRENLRAPYSTTLAISQLLSMTQWLRHEI